MSTSYRPTYRPTSVTLSPTTSTSTDDGNQNIWLRYSAGVQVGTVNGIYTYNGAITDLSTFYALCWVNIAVCSAIIIHSFWLHGLKYTNASVRIQTELGAFFAVMSAVVALVAVKHPTRMYWALLFDLCYNGIFNAIVQLCDNYMFYYRLIAVVRLPLWYRVLINVYIWVVLICTWLPAQTIVPFFYDCNSEIFNSIYTVTLAIDTWGNILYNVYFSVHFILILRKLYGRTTTPLTGPLPLAGMATTAVPKSPIAVLMYYQVTKAVAMKSIGHCITSSFGLLALAYLPGSISNNLCYNLILVTSMHGWFNYTNNNYAYFRKEINEDQWRKISDLSSIEGLTQVKGPSWRKRAMLWMYEILDITPPREAPGEDLVDGSGPRLPVFHNDNINDHHGGDHNDNGDGNSDGNGINTDTFAHKPYEHDNDNPQPSQIRPNHARHQQQQRQQLYNSILRRTEILPARGLSTPHLAGQGQGHSNAHLAIVTDTPTGDGRGSSNQNVSYSPSGGQTSHTVTRPRRNSAHNNSISITGGLPSYHIPQRRMDSGRLLRELGEETAGGKEAEEVRSSGGKEAEETRSPRRTHASTTEEAHFPVIPSLSIPSSTNRIGLIRIESRIAADTRDGAAMRA